MIPPCQTISSVRRALGAMLLAACSLVLLGCTPRPAADPTRPASPWPSTPAPNLAVPEGYQAALVVQGLRGPTQMAMGPDGWLWLAQINGGETASTGQVIAVSPATGEQRLLLDGLFKPTGMAVTPDALWIIAGEALLRAPLQEDFSVGPPQQIATELLGETARSNGTLTLYPDGRLLHSVTFNVEAGADPYLGGGSLWLRDTKPPFEAVILAEGFAKAYAHTLDPSGQIWVANMTEDIIDGRASEDAIYLIAPGEGSDPHLCVYYSDEPTAYYPDNRLPAPCAAARAPLLFLPAHSTPTDIVLSPWEANRLLLPLWLAGEIVQAPVTVDGEHPTIETWETFISGLQNPQSLLVLEDGSLLVSDFGTGMIYRITRLEQGS